eukprot:CAMPEP_0172504526 /NCGR_PEP_ID=MMETSP1066-20121228/179559_1 /TAXON_ID=671091 /ORGANISM="Coscinodiscus wailesii, Strain CCMP2513" /LENGTH=39 /DNA_ID= /DNA_START= /DNA_END= /DNA_ORIENTATION=
MRPSNGVPDNDLGNLVDKVNAPIFGIDVDGKVNEWNYKV